MEKTLSLSHVLIAIIRRRRFIAKVTLLTALAAAGISMVLPKWYKATGSILPPEAGATAGTIATQLLLSGYQLGMIPTGVSPSDLYVAILSSETLRNAVIDSAGLMEAYRLKKRHLALSRLKRYTKTRVGMEGVVTISYEDRDPYRAALVVNCYLKELDRFNKNVRSSSAGRLREFIEKRLDEISAELKQAEDNLRLFREQTGAVFVSEQAKASIETAAEIFVRIAELEVNLERLRTSTTDSNPEVINLRTQINALRRKLEEMGYSRSTGTISEDSMLFPKFKSAAEIQQKLTELLREVEVKSRVLAYLSEQYEQARIEEMKDTPTIQILDWAQPPPVKSRPRSKVVAVVSGAIAFFISSAVAWRRSIDLEYQDKMTISGEIVEGMREDLKQFLMIIGRKSNRRSAV